MHEARLSFFHFLFEYKLHIPSLVVISAIMVFGLFSRKSTLDAPAPAESNQSTTPRLPTPTPSVASATHHSPFRFPNVLRSALGGSSTDLTFKDSDQTMEGVAEGHPPPPVTPSPPPSAGPDDTKILHDLMSTIPPKTLHAYTLAHLQPQAPLSAITTSVPALESHPDSTRPLSPDTVTKLTTFFSTLAPPPLLHCVRCHKDFYSIENEEKDKACRVPHDDESALVSRVSGRSGGYETLWGCCGQTASGDGSEGPPDGWCYEGRHTTDTKRARFRADSTMTNDKLTSCLKLNCRGIRDRLPQRDVHASPSPNVGTSSVRKSNPSPARSQASTLIHRTTRKRPRKSLKGSGSENEADSESLDSRTAKSKQKAKISGSAGEKGEDMAIDAPNSPSKSKPKPKPKSRPVSQTRPIPSTLQTLHAKSGSNPTPVGSTKRGTLGKPKSTSHTLLSQSRTHGASDSEASTRSRPRTRSHVGEESGVRASSRGRPASKLTKADIAERAGRAKKATKPVAHSMVSEEKQVAEEAQDSDEEEPRGRDRKKRRLRG